VMCFILWDDITDEGARTLVSGAIAFDRFSMLGTITICAAVIVASLVTDDYLRREQLEGPEVYGLYLTAAIGAVVMTAANDLIVLFLGLEVLSISFYVLAASHRRRIESQESGIKYFVLGGFSSAFFLYGVALVYGATGSTNLDAIVSSFNATIATDRKDAFVLAGVALLIVGLAFKVSAVPFHFWTPDVYQGAPTPVTAFMASVGKVGAFAALLRVLNSGLPHWRDDWRPAIWVIAVATLVVGSALAVVQTNVKRMLAYSSISHAGFILVGVEASGHTAGQSDVGLGISSSLLYLLLYSVLVLGTFAIVTLVGRTGDAQTDLASFRGLSKTKPLLAIGMTVLLLAQAGVPLTSGFVAKFGVIQAAVEEKSYVLAVVAMLASVIAAFLYLRIMVGMWMAGPETGDDDREAVRVPFTSGLAIFATVAFTLFVGIVPGWLVSASKHATLLSKAVGG
ncbi:MAG: NADH-quinone oxidoreductase subunit N, partial [Actinobacteria bacterium]|nr:NADH-quinone oxidoreductase subunit N [Actinomycetota bacterium]